MTTITPPRPCRFGRPKGLFCATALASVLAALPYKAQAQDVYALEDIVFSASLSEADAERLGVSVSVIDADALARAGEADLGSYLAREAGVSISREGPTGSTSYVAIRGGKQEYVAVYLNGIRLDDPTNPKTYLDLGGLSTGDLARVEILRGSQSALYGSSAVAGVVNITTKGAAGRSAPEGLSQSAYFEAGSYGTLSSGYHLSFKDAALAATLDLSASRSDGFSAADAADGNSEADGSRARALRFTLDHTASERLGWGLSGFYHSAFNEADGYSAQGFGDTAAHQDKTSRGLRAYSTIAFGDTRVTLDATHLRTTRLNDYVTGRSSFEGRRSTVKLQGESDVSQALRLIYGLSQQKEESRGSSITGGASSVTQRSVFAEALWAVTDTLDIDASLRLDDDENFGRFASKRLALAWRPRVGTILRASAGDGYRAPSIDERFSFYEDYLGNISYKGNPALNPETSRSYEIGIEQSLGERFGQEASLSATLFALETDDAISYKQCESFSYTSYLCETAGDFSTVENVSGKTRREGLELSGSLPLSERHLFGLTYSYLDTQTPSGGTLGLTATHTLGLNLSSAWSERLSTDVELRHLRDRANRYGSGSLGDYTVLNAAFSYDLTPDVAFYGRVENITDEAYQLVDDYGTSGRAFYVGLRADF